jgi:transcriptional regulator with XRE-family HTH domain
MSTHTESPASSPVNPFAALLCRRREELGLYQNEVAEDCGVTPEAIGLIEAGRRQPDLERIPRLATALELDPAPLCRLALRVRSPNFYAALLGEDFAVEPAPGEDPAALVVVELDREDAQWVRQMRALDSRTRYHLRELADRLVREQVTRGR